MSLLPDTLMLPPETRLRPGAVAEILDECRPYGGRGLLVCGNSFEHSGRLNAVLARAAPDLDVQVWMYPGGEPTLRQLESLIAYARQCDPHWILGIGGGSVMDIAKAAAGLMDAPLPAVAYHDGETVPHSRRIYIAAPATAGTGSEATIVSVLTNSDTGVKKSIRHVSFMAQLVLLYPELLDGCPQNVIAASGMDALTQGIESYCSKGASWYTDALALKATSLINETLEPVYNGEGACREYLLAGSYLAGIALSNSRLGLVHGLAHPLGARFAAAHGLVCAICLPYVLEFNREAVPEKYGRLSDAVGMDLLARVRELNERLHIRSPFSGKILHDRDAIVQETLASGSTKANPRNVTAANVRHVLDCILG